MPLAHGVVAEGGPNVEALAFAIALGGVGAILFVQKSVKPIVALTMLLVAGLMGAGAFTVLSEQPHEPEPQQAADPYADVTAGLCLAQTAALAGDVESARTYFTDRAHVALHTVVADVESEDRGQAAELLAAKDAVEEAIFTEAPPKGFAKALERLIGETEAAFRTLGRETGLCAM